MRLKRRILLTALVIALLATATALLWPREEEPTYQGRSLSQWLWLYQQATRPNPDTSAKDANQAAQAVRAIGTNAVPLLLTWLSQDIPPWRLKALDEYYAPIAQRLGGSRTAYRAIAGERIVRIGLALTGFELLGPEARQATPGLFRRMKAGDQLAAFALAFIGQDALEPLLSVLNDPNSTNRRTAALAVRRITSPGTNADKIVPVMANCLNDPDPEVAHAAALTLAHMALAPDLALPALTNILNSTNRDVRLSALFAIGQYKDTSPRLMPALITALTDPDRQIRTVATNALKRIAPTVLTQTYSK